MCTRFAFGHVWLWFGNNCFSHVLWDIFNYYSDVIMRTSNHRHPDCLLDCLFSRRSKKTSKLRVTGLCDGNSLVTGGFPSQRTSNMENVSIDDVIVVNFNLSIMWNNPEKYGWGIILTCYIEAQNNTTAILHTIFQIHFLEWRCMNFD